MMRTRSSEESFGKRHDVEQMKPCQIRDGGWYMTVMGGQEHTISGSLFFVEVVLAVSDDAEPFCCRIFQGYACVQSVFVR